MKDGKKYTVKLSKDEVDILVDHIKKFKTSDVESLCLSLFFPRIYNKLAVAYCKKANCSVKKIRRILECFLDDDIDHEMLSYCECRLDYDYYFEPERYYDTAERLNYEDDPYSYQDEIDDLKYDDFACWYYDYLSKLSNEETLDFFSELVVDGVIEDYIKYSVKIPTAIINKAKK